jgi:hypothetical protein
MIKMHFNPTARQISAAVAEFEFCGRKKVLSRPSADSFAVGRRQKEIRQNCFKKDCRSTNALN